MTERELKNRDTSSDVDAGLSGIVHHPAGTGGRRVGVYESAILRAYHLPIALWHEERAGTATDFVADAARLQARLTDLLRERPMPDPDNQRLRDDLRWRHARGGLLRFLDDPRIEPTNNRAERALRPAVIARKVSQCSKNQRGADAFAVFASVTRTLSRRGHAPINGLAILFQGALLPP